MLTFIAVDLLNFNFLVWCLPIASPELLLAISEFIFYFGGCTPHHALCRFSHPADLSIQFSHCCISLCSSWVGYPFIATASHTPFLMLIILFIVFGMKIEYLILVSLHKNLPIINFNHLAFLEFSYFSQIIHDKVFNSIFLLSIVFRSFFITIFFISFFIKLAKITHLIIFCFWVIRLTLLILKY